MLATNNILFRSSRHFFLRHPWQLGLAITGIALAVAVVVSVDLINQSAGHSFERSTETIVGRATHRIVGGPAGLDERLYTRMRVEYGVRDIAPVIEAHVTLEKNEQRETLTLLGLDSFAERTFRAYAWFDNLQNPDGEGVLIPLLTERNTVLLDAATATRLNLRANDEATLITGGRSIPVHVAGILAGHTHGSSHSPDNLMLADIATAQEVLDMSGRINRVDVVIGDGDDSTKSRLQSLLPDGVALLPATTRTRSLKQMTGAFHTNLTALSLLALLVGMFLIYNTMTFMVMQRRPLLGTLRALGATRRQLGAIIAIEALLVGLAATFAGLLLGVALAHGLLQVVNRTMNEVYDLLTDANLTLSNLSLLKGALLGMAGTLLAAIPAALEATRVTPRQALLRSHLEASAQRLVFPASMAGIVALGAGFMVIQLSSPSIELGFSGIFIIILGITLLIPLVTVVLMACLKPLLGGGFGISGRYACQSVTASLSRTTAAIAALMIAIATVIGIGLMVNNFRLSVDRWLQQTLRAEMYVSLPSTGTTASAHALDAGFADAVLALPQVKAVSSVRRINIESSLGQTELSAYGLNEAAWEGFQFKQGEADEIWTVFQQEDTVIVSEPYAWRHGVERNAMLELRTDNGYRAFRVLGVYKDYGSDQGIVSMSRRIYDRHWRDDRYSGFGIYTLPGTDMELLRRQVQQLAPERDLWLQDRNKILQTSLEVFDNTFVVTDILRVLAAIIAFIGVFSALMALQLERSQEHALLRSLGFLPGQMRRLIISETGLLGLVAGLLAVPVGCIITALLILVINRRSFGWTMELQFSADIVLQGIVLGLAAALLAGIYPAWKISSSELAEALRKE
ncbi:MAG: FtsX-like permease family protein [Gammaproteobacteria bacterium]|nr:FtsX-like permease family protein [Gammaproteobacteria bacterium]